jgi:hypothetical protein
MNFYPRVRIWIQISIHNLFADGWVITLPDPLPFLLEEVRFCNCSKNRAARISDGNRAAGAP